MENNFPNLHHNKLHRNKNLLSRNLKGSPAEVIDSFEDGDVGELTNPNNTISIASDGNYGNISGDTDPEIAYLPSSEFNESVDITKNGTISANIKAGQGASLAFNIPNSASSLSDLDGYILFMIPSSDTVSFSNATSGNLNNVFSISANIDQTSWFNYSVEFNGEQVNVTISDSNGNLVNSTTETINTQYRDNKGIGFYQTSGTTFYADNITFNPQQ
jgi:hypothetical protein